MSLNVKEELQIVIEDMIKAIQQKNEAEAKIKKLKPQLIQFYGDENFGFSSRKEYYFKHDFNNVMLVLTGTENIVEDVDELVKIWNTEKEARAYLIAKPKLSKDGKDLLEADTTELTGREKRIQTILSNAITYEEGAIRVSIKPKKEGIK